MPDTKRGKAAAEHKPFEIFRATDRRSYAEHDVMDIVADSPAIVAGLTAFASEGGGFGQTVTMAYSRPGFSLSHVWFKSGYPLPLHSHAGDCLYYLLAGSVRMGSEELGPGDGFFVSSEVPYTYETGPEGAEVLEFRATDQFNIRFMAKNKTAWDKTVARLRARRDLWVDEPPPSQRAPAAKPRPQRVAAKLFAKKKVATPKSVIPGKRRPVRGRG